MTVRHVVSWQLSASDPATRAEHAAAIVRGLRSLVGVVQEIRELHTGVDMAGSSNWDVALIADFDDLDAVSRYQVHPAHQEVAVFIRSVVAQRMAVDFEV
jgi:beta-xylosidase